MEFDPHDSFLSEPLDSGETPPPSSPHAGMRGSEIPLGERKSIHSGHSGHSGQPLIADDLRVPWGWLDLLIFALVAVIGALVVNVILIIMFAAFGVTMAKFRDSPPEMGLLAVLSQTVLFLGLLGYLAVQIRIRVNTSFWRTIGWRPLEKIGAPRTLNYLGLVAGGLFFSFFLQLRF